MNKCGFEGISRPGRAPATSSKSFKMELERGQKDLNPLIVVWRFLQRSNGSDVLATKQALLIIVLLQFVPRFGRIVPLTSELKRTAGVIAETAWAGAAYYLLLYMLASHIVGAF
ncbi:hypothetical protein L6452_31190 [Arctium lappa]|uniref:Uncharacterized protein n=1 Tax=Arctium lappa TaxID=4217 RepID=A0ACB8ZKG8_ARCLA|nr:hypothetical protein L6452_31190 [Arctium lappa]